ERREALSVEEGVVFEVDEYLRAARIRLSRIRERHVAPLVTLLHGVVGERRASPRGGDGWIGVHAELHHEIRHDAKEPGLLVEAVLGVVVEAIRAKRRPIPVDGHDDQTLA